MKLLAPYCQPWLLYSRRQKPGGDDDDCDYENDDATQGLRIFWVQYRGAIAISVNLCVRMKWPDNDLSVRYHRLRL